MTSIFLDIDFSEINDNEKIAIDFSFKNHKKIKISKTPFDFFQTPIFELTGDENEIIDWIQKNYDDSADSNQIEKYMNQSTPESISI